MGTSRINRGAFVREAITLTTVLCGPKNSLMFHQVSLKGKFLDLQTEKNGLIVAHKLSLMILFHSCSSSHWVFNAAVAKRRSRVRFAYEIFFFLSSWIKRWPNFLSIPATLKKCFVWQKWQIFSKFFDMSNFYSTFIGEAIFGFMDHNC